MTITTKDKPVSEVKPATGNGVKDFDNATKEGIEKARVEKLKEAIAKLNAEVKESEGLASKFEEDDIFDELGEVAAVLSKVFGANGLDTVKDRTWKRMGLAKVEIAKLDAKGEPIMVNGEPVHVWAITVRTPTTTKISGTNGIKTSRKSQDTVDGTSWKAQCEALGYDVAKQSGHLVMARENREVHDAQCIAFQNNGSCDQVGKS